MGKYLYWCYGNEGVHNITRRGKTYNAWAKPKVYFATKKGAEKFRGNSGKRIHRVLKWNVLKSIHINK